MLTIQSASNPKYASADGTSISLDVKFAEVNLIVPFNATPTDSVPYGIELYTRAKNGEFGSIAPYTPPQPAK
jgi:hypothetical protein